MKRITSIILMCLMLGGPNSSWAQATPAPAFERWKSCVELFQPKGFALISDLQGQISQPTNIRELLQNLQLIWKRELLLQPSFYDPATVRKLFAGSAVSWGEPLHPLPPDTGFVVAQLDSSLLPGVTIRAESRCWLNHYKSASGPEKLLPVIMGVLTLSDKTLAGMGLSTIRAVFGPETVNAIDVPFYQDGGIVEPLGKGHVAYVDQAREKAEVLPQRITFFFDDKSSQHTPERPTKIVDQDVVLQVEMRVDRHLKPDADHVDGINVSVPETSSTALAAAQPAAPSQSWKSCAEQVSPPGALATNLKTQFERPQDLSQMLQNLKLAWDHEWLLRADFYDEETLLKFFNAAAITWKPTKDPQSPPAEIALETHSALFPQMAIVLEAHCRSTTFAQPSGHRETVTSLGGNFRIYGPPIPELTLATLRQALGPETQNQLDSLFAGETELLQPPPPTDKGSVVYTDPDRQKRAGARIGLEFFFSIPSKPTEPFQPRIVPEDVVQGIVLSDGRQRIVVNEQ